MAKILGEGGKSLADIYDVVGSVVAVDEIEADSVTAVHELGALINSERMGSSIALLKTGDLNQSADVLVEMSGFTGITRVLNVFVYADAGSRVNDVSVNIQDAGAQREVPLFMWETGQDAEFTARILSEGNAGGFRVLRPAVQYLTLPGMVFGAGQRAQCPVLTMRGTTGGFGAGTVEIFAAVQIANADVTGTGTGAPSNIGLPIPSW